MDKNALAKTVAVVLLCIAGLLLVVLGFMAWGLEFGWILIAIAMGLIVLGAVLLMWHPFTITL